MLSSALISLGVAGSALAWPSLSHSRHSSIARAIHARQEPAVKAKEPVAATWFASWHADEFSLANVSWSKYTTVSYSFAVTTPNISYVNISDPEVFKDFVSTAHANNVSATISIGGWTGSLYFSSAVATAENRTEFVKTMVSLLEDNNLDGLSFDWEYPGASGVGCNTKSVNDTDNFLLFLKELRTALPSNATISAATSITPFLSAEGTPSTNVSEFATVFDYIQLMNYDVWGPWSDTTGPNAPLNDTCATNTTQKVGSAVSAVEAWTKAGFPADQLVLGVAGYGHGFAVESANALSDGILNAYSPFNKSSTPPGDAWDDAPVNGTVDVCGNPQAQGGTWNFWGLIEGGFLNENGTANTAEGIAYKYDECSQTPFVYNQTSGVMVAFDNAASFTAKGQFINTTGLRGFALWEAGGDFDDILLDAIRSGAGFPEVVEDDDDCSDDETGTTTPETGSSSNNSGSNNSGSTSNNNSGSSNSGSTSTTPSTSNNSGSSSSNNSGSSSSNNSGSNGSSSTSTPTTSNSGSNNSGSNNSGSSTTTPDYGDDDDEDCEDDDEPTTVTSAASSKPTATAAATSEDDEECEDDDEYSEPEVTTANPTTYQAPTAVVTPSTPSTSTAQSVATPEATIPDDDEDDEECEDDETIIDATTSVIASTTASTTATASVTSRSASVISTGTVSSTFSAASSDATVTSTVSESSGTLSAASSTATESAVTSSSIASESNTVTETETASTSQATPSADKDFVSTVSASSSSYEPSSTASDAEPAATSVHSSSSAATTSSEPTTSARATSSFEAPASAESATSVHQTSSYSEASPESASTVESSTSATPTSTHPVATTSVQTTSAEPAPTPAAPASSASSSSSAVPTSAPAEPAYR